MKQKININGRLVGEGAPPYIVSELSANHNGSIERAKKIIEISKKAGADAVKLQTYRADTITMKSNSPEFQINGGLWDGYSLYDLYEWAHMPWDWHKPLFDYAESLGITIFSSPFDETAIDLLEDLNAPAYKIASFEAVDLPLIAYAAQTKKPLIISSGMANLEEIEAAYDTAKENGCEELILLHCVSGYPAPPEEYNLNTLIDIKQRFKVPVGLSDHTIDNTTAITSVALGANLIEKHVTLSRGDGGPDDSFSLEPKDLKELCDQSKIAWQSMGKVDYGLKSSERESVKFRRSLYFLTDVNKGQIITKDHVKSIRPGYGVSPNHINSILGKIAPINFSAGKPVSEENLKEIIKGTSE